MLNLIPLPYRIIGGLIAMSVIIGGSIAYGYNKAENKYLVKIATYKQEAELLKEQLNASLSEVKVEVLTKYVDKIKIVKEKEYVYVDNVIYVPSKCELATGWVLLHNASATSGGIGASGVTDATPSGIKDTEALRTVIGNYSICHQNAKQLEALQEYVIRREEEIKKYNKNIKK